MDSELSPSRSSAVPVFPANTVANLLESDLVTPQTRRVLQERLSAQTRTTPQALSTDEFATLRAVCDRLIPQLERTKPIDIAGAIDDRLARYAGKGWRYASMPPDIDAYKYGLHGIDECARELFAAPFISLSVEQQDGVLANVQNGTADGTSWMLVPCKLFFEELLAEVVESYYSHPLAQEEIGYAGFADAHGWQQIGLDQLDAHEPRAL